MKAKKKLSLLLCLVMITGLFAGLITSAAAASPEPAKSSITLDEINGKTVGVLTGSIHDKYAKQFFPDSQLEYFLSVNDLITAVSSGTIFTFSCDLLTANALLAENDTLAFVDVPLDKMPTALAFSKTDKGAALRDEVNEYLAKLEAEGTLKELQNKWLSYGAGDYDLDMTGLTGNEKTVVFATSCSGKPNSYYFNNKPTGYEIEIIAMFCREYGYNLDIQVTDFAGIIPGLVSGMYDIGADGIGVTEERKESINFSDPDYECPLVMIVRKTDEEVSSAGAAGSASRFNSEDVTLGVVTGMATDMIYAEYMPKAQLDYFNSTADTINAVKSGQIAGFLDDEPMSKYLVAHTDGLKYIDEIIGPQIDTAFFVGKTDFDRKLLGELNEFIVKLKADGTVDEIFELWYGTDEEKQHLSIPTEGVNGTVRVAIYSQAAPIIMYKGGELCGVEIDILSRFAKEYGYALEFDDMDFAAIINAVNSGRCNIGSAFFSVTEERKQSVTFTEPYYKAGYMLVVSADDTQESSFIAGLKESFHKTFIKEDRWKLIVEGIETTMVISVCAAVLGTVLGFGLCLLRRMKNKVIHAFTTVYIRILQGTPLLVLLMILYYIVFAKSGTSGVLVAVIAFAMNFAAYTCEMFRTGIDSVDIGQTEAAYAIGFTKSRTFFKIILPQAALHFLPVYKGEFISLVKMTSIVGYIAVQDLTKMSDIIRSRTYEAFFPLIATAIIYFILTALLTGLLRVVEIKVEPNRENRKVKGVKMQ